MKTGLLSLSLLTLFLVSTSSFAAQASSTSFSAPVKLGPGFDPNVQSVGSYVYVAWTDKSNGIFFRASSNDGKTWAAAIKIGNGGEYPIVSASGNHVYVVWSSGGIMFASSSNKGVTWSKSKLTSSPGITPFIASNGALVSVVYLAGAGGGSFVTTSTDAGKTWSKPFQYSKGPEPQIAISGSNIYVVSDTPYKVNIQFGVSHDSGNTWKLTKLPAGSEAWIVASGSHVYAVWETKSTSSSIQFMSSSDNGDILNTKIISGRINDAWNPMINANNSKVWVGIQEFGGKAQNWMLTSTNGGSTWKSVSLTGLEHIDGFIFNVPTTDGNNIFAMWIQKSGSTSSTALVAYSSNGGSTWSTVKVGPSDPNEDVAIGSISSNGSHGFAVWQYNSEIYFAGS